MGGLPLWNVIAELLECCNCVPSASTRLTRVAELARLKPYLWRGTSARVYPSGHAVPARHLDIRRPAQREEDA